MHSSPTGEAARVLHDTSREGDRSLLRIVDSPEGSESQALLYNIDSRIGEAARVLHDTSRDGNRLIPAITGSPKGGESQALSYNSINQAGEAARVLHDASRDGNRSIPAIIGSLEGGESQALTMQDNTAGVSMEVDRVLLNDTHRSYPRATSRDPQEVDSAIACPYDTSQRSQTNIQQRTNLTQSPQRVVVRAHSIRPRRQVRAPRRFSPM